MKPTDSVFPVFLQEGLSHNSHVDPGIDLRTYLAGQAMQGMIAHPNIKTYEEAAMCAVELADALIVELNKEQK